MRDLRDRLQRHPEAVVGREVFLLRNLSRGRGLSFFSARDGEVFYPDFILWVIEDGRQGIVFIDPHGLGRARGLSDPKIQLHRRLAGLQPALQRNCRKWQVRLTSFIVSPTPYDEAQRSSWVSDHILEALAGEHVLFQEGDYVARLWSALVADWPSTTSAGTSARAVGGGV